MKSFIEKNVKLIIKLMGEALDLARISGMSDRSFNQFQISYKKKCFNAINELIKEAKENKLVDENFKVDLRSRNGVKEDRNS
jgi:hypothetical protein